MSEEEGKEKPKVTRFISSMALVISIATFLLSLLIVPGILWITFYPEAGHDFDFIGMFLTAVAVLSIICMFRLWPIAVIGLVLSIVTLFIERNKYLRFLPLAFFIVGICFYTILFVSGYIYG